MDQDCTTCGLRSANLHHPVCKSCIPIGKNWCSALEGSMVRVVGRDERYVRKATCHHCASILEYTNSETKEKTVSDYGGGRDIVNYITCPSCGNEITV